MGKESYLLCKWKLFQCSFCLPVCLHPSPPCMPLASSLWQEQSFSSDTVVSWLGLAALWNISNNHCNIMVFYCWTIHSSSVATFHVLFQHKKHHVSAKHQFNLANHRTWASSVPIASKSKWWCSCNVVLISRFCFFTFLGASYPWLWSQQKTRSFGLFWWVYSNLENYYGIITAMTFFICKKYLLEHQLLR